MKIKPIILLDFLVILLIVIIIAFIWYIIWQAIFMPIRKKDTLEKELESKRMELQQIQAQKGIEWDQYKKLIDELDKLKKAHLDLKNKNNELSEKNAKLQVDKENIQAVNKELKSQLKS